MERKQILWTGVGGLAAVSLLLSTALVAQGDSVNPTRAEALAGVTAAKTYVQQHPGDTGEAEALAGADSLNSYINGHIDPTPPPTTVPPTTTAPAASPLPANVTAVPAANKITLSWSAPTGYSPTGYIYGRSGTDNTGTGPWTSTAQSSALRSVVLDKLIDGQTYTVFVEAVYASGNQRVSRTVVAGVPATTAPPTTTVPPTVIPTTTAAPTTAPPTTTPPVTGNRPSGLAWSSGVWSNGDRTMVSRFKTEVRGGRGLDNLLVYTWRNNFANQNLPSQWKAELPADFNPATQDLVLGVTTWMADGTYLTNAQAKTLGTSVCGVDSNAIVRLDWEMNLDDGAGDNGAELTSSNFSAWTARFNTVALGLKSTCPGIRIDYNPNHGADQTPGCNTSPVSTQCSRRAFQAVKANVDIFGIDRYDSYNPVTASGSGWSSHLSGFNELDESRTYALANGKKWSVPEWGLWTGGPGGNDDPEYIKRYIAYFVAHSGDMAYETYFNEPNPYIISDLVDHNPNSRAQYKASILAQ